MKKFLGMLLAVLLLWTMLLPAAAEADGAPVSLSVRKTAMACS